MRFDKALFPPAVILRSSYDTHDPAWMSPRMAWIASVIGPGALAAFTAYSLTADAAAPQNIDPRARSDSLSSTGS